MPWDDCPRCGGANETAHLNPDGDIYYEPCHSCAAYDLAEKMEKRLMRKVP